jgi:hypothetical protein
MPSQSNRFFLRGPQTTTFGRCLEIYCRSSSLSKFPHRVRPSRPHQSPAMLLLALVSLLSAVSIASREGDCLNVAHNAGSDRIHVVSTQYLSQGSTINYKSDGLNVTCQMTPALPIPVNICRGIFNITTSPSSSTIVEVWLPDQSENRLLSVGNKQFDGCQ